MKIIELRASNFARLRAVEIRPDGHLVAITGKNKEGKSSVLRAIWTALAGRAAAPPRPIREGAEQATIKLDLGELTVTRTFTHKKAVNTAGAKVIDEVTHDLVVRDADGGRVGKTPQALLDGLLGSLSFDPLAFARMKPADQFAELRKLVPGFDFEAAALERRKLFDNRTDVNRSLKNARARAGGIKLPPGPRPALEDVSALAGELKEAVERNAERTAALAALETGARDVDRMLDEAEDLRSRASVIEDRVAAKKKALEALKESVPLEIDTSVLSGSIANARAVGEAVRAFEQRDEWEKVAAENEEESARLTAEIEVLDRTEGEAIAQAHLPAGLTLSSDEDGAGTVMLNGLPFEQASTAEKILASAEAGMALAPDLRVMLIDEGSELDTQMLAALADLAKRKDHQVWICRVEEGEGSGAGVRIEDGTVVDPGATSGRKRAGDGRASIEHSDPGLR